jgi:hypothetical protein
MEKEDLEYLKDVLEDITYWETCPDNYKQRLGVLIELISEELIELKKLRVTDVSSSLPTIEQIETWAKEQAKIEPTGAEEFGRIWGAMWVRGLIDEKLKGNVA